MFFAEYIFRFIASMEIHFADNLQAPEVKIQIPTVTNLPWPVKQRQSGHPGDVWNLQIFRKEVIRYLLDI